MQGNSFRHDCGIPGEPPHRLTRSDESSRAWRCSCGGFVCYAEHQPCAERLHREHVVAQARLHARGLVAP